VTRQALRAISACFLISVSLIAQAQSNFANLHGAVRDPHRQPIANAPVVLTATTTGANSSSA